MLQEDRTSESEVHARSSPAARRTTTPDATAPAWLDGGAFLAAIGRGGTHLAAHSAVVDALNVFPVPDGDTGRNMTATIDAAIREAEAVPEHARDVGRVAGALAFGALMGARGNSGVILSQLLRGMADVLRDRESVDGGGLAQALRAASDAAARAVATPVEGTILTVAREAATAAEAAVENARGDPVVVLDAAARAAREAVARTPSQLRVLADAGVVDAGGEGLALLLDGVLACLVGRDVPEGRPLDASSAHDATPPPVGGPGLAIPEVHESAFGYETMFLLTGKDPLRPDEIRAHLETLGDSVLVAGDETMVKVHVHGDRPDAVIAYGLSLGGISRVTVENLDQQIHDQAHERVSHARGASQEAESGPPTGVAGAAAGAGNAAPAVVAVAPGPGFVRLYRELGAAIVVPGGGGDNPAVADLASAIRGTRSVTVLVLTNNPNIAMAAEQAAALCREQEVRVVPTRTPAEGVAAMLALDARRPAAANATAMLEAARAVTTLQVARAVRPARVGDRNVEPGEWVVLDPDEGLLAAGGKPMDALDIALRSLTTPFELLTVYRGADARPPDAARLADDLRRAFEGVEVELVDGGQRHYDFLVSVE